MQPSNQHGTAPLSHPFPITLKISSQGNVLVIKQRDHLTTVCLSRYVTTIYNLKSKKKQ